MPLEDTDKARQIIKKWMEDSGVFDDEAGPEEELFHYHGNGEFGVHYCVVQPDKTKRIIGIVSGSSAIEDYKRILENLDLKEREEFFIDIKKELLSMPIWFSFESEDNPGSIMIVKELSVDEITEARLMEATNLICRAVTIVSLMFQKKFGEPKEE